MDAQVLILGGGITGMQTACELSQLGIPSVLVEKSASLGGRVTRLSRVIPFFKPGQDIVHGLETDLSRQERVSVRLSTTLTRLEGDAPHFTATLSDGTSHQVAAVVLAVGFEPYDPSPMREYGYGQYANVVTSSELEWMLNPAGPTQGKLLRPSDGAPVQRLGIIFCVGSRNRRLGAPFCSRICCSYSTKQAILVREQNPKADVTCFYMDVRTYDRGFEEMYARAQDSGVRYIRGRVSSCKQDPDGSISIRAENTLLGKPFASSFDLVSLSTGMRPCADSVHLEQLLGVTREEDGFFSTRSFYRHPYESSRVGVFLAGCATGMKPVKDCLVDGGAVASRVAAAVRGLWDRAFEYGPPPPRAVPVQEV